MMMRGMRIRMRMRTMMIMLVMMMMMMMMMMIMIMSKQLLPSRCFTAMDIIIVIEVVGNHSK